MAYLHFLVLVASTFSYGQVQSLDLLPCNPSKKTFATVRVIDKRPGVQMIGFVQKGGFNRLAEVTFNGSLADSIGQFFVNKNSVNSSNGKELVVILNEFFLSEKTEALSETGRFKLSIRLFSTSDEKFRELIHIDSLYEFNAMDVTKRLLRSVSERLCEIARKATDLDATLKAKDSVLYSFNDLLAIDSLDKSKIPIYTTSHIKAGIYKNFEQFKANSPDSVAIYIEALNSKNIKVFSWDKQKNKRFRISNESIYAVCDGVMLVRANSRGFFEMKKEGNDFFYIGQTSTSSTSNVAMWGAAFGLIGAAIASGAERNTTLHKFKISYLKGNSIPISKASY